MPVTSARPMPTGTFIKRMLILAGLLALPWQSASGQSRHAPYITGGNAYTDQPGGQNPVLLLNQFIGMIIYFTGDWCDPTVCTDRQPTNGWKYLGPVSFHVDAPGASQTRAFSMDTCILADIFPGFWEGGPGSSQVAQNHFAFFAQYSTPGTKTWVITAHSCDGSNTLLAQQSVDFTIGSVLVDPVPALLSGSTVHSVSSAADAQLLATSGTAVQGIAADGVSELVVRIPAVNFGDSVTVTVLNDQNGAGTPNEDGALCLPGNATCTSSTATTITTSAVSTTSNKVYAFVVYRAPIDFARPLNGTYKTGTCGSQQLTDDQLACRSVTLQIQINGPNNTIPFPVTIVRPPVILIHGLWGDRHGWDNFSPLFSNGTADPTFSVPRFYVHAVDYSAHPNDVAILSSTPNYGLGVLAKAGANSLGFQYNAFHVMDTISKQVALFKKGTNPAAVPVAAIQADIVGHSMGGDISRTIALQYDFLSKETFGQGNIHKLITIGTPHLGSPLATQLLQSQNSCVANFFTTVAGNPAFSFVQITSSSLGGAIVSLPAAVGDLAGDNPGGNPSPSQALLNIAAPGQHPLPTALIAGTTNNANLASLGSDAVALGLHFSCGTLAGNPLATNLTPTGWNTIFGQLNDAIVSRGSQLNGLNPDPGLVVDGTLHSPGIHGLGFAGPSELDSGPVPTQVVYLLNTPVTNALFHLLNP